MRSLCLWALLVWLPLTAWAAPVAPVALNAQTEALGEVSVAGHFESYYDPSGLLTERQVIAQHARDFRPVAGNFGGGYRSGAWWLRFTLDVAGGDGDGWWLRLHAPFVEELDLWVTQDEGGTVLQHVVLGRIRPLAQRGFKGPGDALVEINPLVSGPSTVWLRLAGQRSVTLRATIGRHDQVMTAQQKNLALGMANVLLPIMLFLISTLLFMTLRDRRLLWFAMHEFECAFLMIDTGGYFGTWLLSGAPVLADHLGTASVCLSLGTASMVGLSLLEIRKRFPRLVWPYAFFGVCSVVCTGFALTGHYGRVGPLLVLATLAEAILSALVAAVWVRRRVPGGGWMLLGFGSRVASLLFPLLIFLGLLPPKAVLSSMISLALPLSWVFLIIAIGFELRRANQSAIRLQAKALHATRRSAAELEGRVAERTRELRVEIEQRRSAEAGLQQALSTQRSFLGMVSHEFRNPLGSIMVSAQTLASVGGDAAQAQRSTRRILRASHHMADLVDTLLADEWMSSASMQPRPCDFDATTMVADLCERFVEDGRGGIVTRLPDAPSIYHGDSVLLEIVFRNLIENAVKFSPPERAIDVTLTEAGGALGFVVRDRGAGIAAADLPRIFDRYYRASTAGATQGLGLGLYMCKRIVELHGGTIEARNAPDGGAEFEVVLPQVGVDAR